VSGAEPIGRPPARHSAAYDRHPWRAGIPRHFRHRAVLNHRWSISRCINHDRTIDAWTDGLRLTSGCELRPTLHDDELFRYEHWSYRACSPPSSSSSSATMTIPNASVIFRAAASVRGAPMTGAMPMRMFWT